MVECCCCSVTTMQHYCCSVEYCNTTTNSERLPLNIVIDPSLYFPFRHCYRWQLDSPFWFIVTFQLWCNFWRPSIDLNIITRSTWISEKILRDSIWSKWLRNDSLLLKISSYYRRQSIKRLDFFWWLLFSHLSRRGKNWTHIFCSCS